MDERIWRIERGEGPLVATALHDGHAVREEVFRHMALADGERLREEDPFTGRLTDVAPTRVVGLRSRFEVDLNRVREKAVYLTPEDAWGLQVWKGHLPEELVARSLKGYDAFYGVLESLFREMAERHGRFLVLDLHSYNHRRGGPGAPAADASENPQVNIGTGTIADRGRWAGLIDRFMGDLGDFDFPGGRLDVRENIRFKGGAFAKWAHGAFPQQGCVLSIEFKKFFMDEWTGEPDEESVAGLEAALRAAIPGALEELEKA